MAKFTLSTLLLSSVLATSIMASAAGGAGGAPADRGGVDPLLAAIYGFGTISGVAPGTAAAATDPWAYTFDTDYSPPFEVSWKQVCEKSGMEIPLESIAESLRSYSAHYGLQKYLVLKGISLDLVPEKYKSKAIAEKPAELLVCGADNGIFIVDMSQGKESFYSSMPFDMEKFLTEKPLPEQKFLNALWIMGKALSK